MKKEATLGTIVKWRENILYAPVAFCVIRNLISKLQIMLGIARLKKQET